MSGMESSSAPQRFKVDPPADTDMYQIFVEGQFSLLAAPFLPPSPNLVLQPPLIWRSNILNILNAEAAGNWVVNTRHELGCF